MGSEQAPRSRRWLPLLAALAPLLVFAPTLLHGFLLDDYVLYRDSPSLGDLSSISRGFTLDVGAVRKGAATAISSYYRPLFLAACTLYYHLVGGEPAAWHLVAVLLAALAAALAFGVLGRLGLEPRLALLAAIAWALHPSHVGSVAWVAGIQELMAAGFALLAVRLLLWRGEAVALPVVLATLAFAGAVLCKEVGVALAPFVACWWLLSRQRGAAAEEPAAAPAPVARLRAATVSMAAVTLVYLAVRVAVLGALASRLVNAPRGLAALTAVPVAAATYLQLLLLPFGFSIFRPERPVYAAMAPRVLLSIGLLVALGALAVWGMRWRRSLALPIAWFAVWLLPVLNVWALDPQWMVSDRYLFLPSLALPWLLALVLPRRVAVATLALLALGYAALTVRYERIFLSERTFLAAMERAEPTSPLVFAEKGRLLQADGDLARARVALTRAVALDPTAPAAAIGLGDLELRRGELDAAERHYRAALLVRPDASRGFKLVVIARAHAGERERALSLAEESARRWPQDFEVRLIEALLLAGHGERERAEAAFAAARRLRPDEPAVAGGLDAAVAALGPTVGVAPP
ncbi:MAG TPA: tetratricopeptide repeat protein [Thermoanaerobaculia bacterium]|nr:tetratricopeptide repeat protein [Thermoanaerobaculia bacterium]